MSTKSFSIDHILKESKSPPAVAMATPPEDHHKPADLHQSASAAASAASAAHLIQLDRDWMIKMQYPTQVYDAGVAAPAWPMPAPPSAHFWPPAIDLHFVHNRTAPVWHSNGHNWPFSHGK